MLPLIAAGVGAAANLAGSWMSSKAAEERANQNTWNQIAFARHGLKWKVEDAKEAGIHPLYAMGASTHSFSPVSVGDTSLGSGLAAAGQDISRGLMATRTGPERDKAYDDAYKALTLKRLGLENDLLASKIATNNQAGSPPAMPSIGGGEADQASSEIEKSKFTPEYMMAGKKILSSPRWSDAQTLEDRLGDDAITKIPIGLSDIAHTAGWTEANWKENLLRRYVQLMSSYMPLRALYKQNSPWRR